MIRNYRVEISILSLGVTVSLLLLFLFPPLDNDIYYNVLSFKLSGSYFDHPPVLMYLLRLVSEVTGSLENFRAVPFFSWIITLVFFVKWVEGIAGRQAAIIASVLFSTNLVFWANSFIVLPDGPMFALAVGSLFFFERKQIVLCGLFLGAAGMAKWSAVVLVPYMLFRFWSSRHEEGISNTFKKVGILFVIAGACQVPQIYWNFANDWPSFRFHFNHRYQKAAPSFLSMVGSVFQTLLLIVLSGGAASIVGFRSSVIGRLREQAKKYVFLWVGFGFAVFPFLVAGLKGQSRLHWFGLAWVFLIPLLASAVSEIDWRKLKTRILFGNIAFAVLLGLVALPIPAMLNEYELLRPIRYDLRANVSGSLTGWSKWSQIPEISAALKNPDFGFLSSNFHLAPRMILRAPEILNGRVATEGDPHHFSVWGNKFDPSVKSLVLFGDNRWSPKNRLEGACDQRFEWQTFGVKQGGFLVKEITWGICNKPSLRYFKSSASN